MVTKSMLKRISILFFVTFVLLALIEGKLIYSTLINYQNIKNKADDQQMRSFPLKAERGLIYDIYNRPLVINEPTLTMYAIPYQVKDKELAAAKISEILDIDKNKFYEKLNTRSSIVSFSNETKLLDYDTASKIQNLNIEGIYLVTDYKRQYPYAPYLSSLLGFVGSDLQGLAGIEAKYDSYLQGKKGYLNYYVDAKGDY